MSSSTFLSDKRALILITAILVSAPLSLLYTTKGNPEVRFWQSAVERKHEWADKMHQTGSILVFSGGSTTAFQIDSELLFNEFDIATVNLGLHAGMGLDGTVALASTFLKKGDELVLMSEPGMLAAGGGSFTALASQMLVADNPEKDFFAQNNISNTSKLDFYLKCRPGLYHATTMLAKVLKNRPLYRYNKDDLHSGGLISTNIRENLVGANTEVSHYQLSENGKTFLAELHEWTSARGVRLSYTLPVSYVSADIIEQQRSANMTFLHEIGEIIPVWTDEFQGASHKPENFSDTGRHMTRDAARLRTRLIATANRNPRK